MIYGASDQGRCTIDVVEREGLHRIVGLLDDAAPPGTEVYGHRVLGPGSAVAELRVLHGFDAAIVAIGDNFGRSQVVARLEALDPGLAFATTVDPSVVLGHAVAIGAGAVLMAGVIVNGSSTIGRHALLCARASLDHDCSLGDFSSLAPSATTGGRVNIGHHSTVALGASVIHGRTIGEHTVIGAGATVVKDIPPFTVAYGSPCRPVRTRRPGDHYL
ncbi:acetyltransferase [soil metagenome]